jgi:hypothetical protein
MEHYHNPSTLHPYRIERYKKAGLTGYRVMVKSTIQNLTEKGVDYNIWQQRAYRKGHVKKANVIK